MPWSLYQIIGWYGVAAILLAYGLVTQQIVDVTAWSYLLLNGSGALALIVQSVSIKNYQLIVLNVVWLLVAVSGVIGLLL